MKIVQNSKDSFDKEDEFPASSVTFGKCREDSVTGTGQGELCTGPLCALILGACGSLSQFKGRASEETGPVM